MAKNELLEEILDELSVIKGKDEARDKQLTDILSTLKELLDKFAQIPQNGKNDNAPPGNLKIRVSLRLVVTKKSAPAHAA